MSANTYTTKQGDMWDGIAYNIYGDERRMDVLMAANPAWIRTVVFSAGVVLQVPDVAPNVTQNLPPWRRS